VETNKAWMRWLRPVARPLFAWNHDRDHAVGGVKDWNGNWRARKRFDRRNSQ
jgi:hypothetical protein